MSNIEHKNVAVAVGIWGTFLSMGAALGLSVSGAIWNSVFPTVLEATLPLESKYLAKQIFGSLPTQLQKPLGSPMRNAVMAAYWATQQKMVIVGICVVPVAIHSGAVDVGKMPILRSIKTRQRRWTVYYGRPAGSSQITPGGFNVVHVVDFLIPFLKS